GAGFNATISCVAQPVCAIGSAGGYAMCQNGTVPGGQGLTAASCGAFNSTRILDFPGAAFTTKTASAASAPAGATSVLTVPALPVGATVSAVRLLVHGIEPTVAANSWSNEVRVELSGALSGLPQTSGALTGTAGTTAAVALGTYVVAGPFTGWPAGGTVTAKLFESALDGGNPDAYIADMTLEIDYSVPTPFWYNAATGGTHVGSGPVFDPVAVALVNPAVPGSTSFYASCVPPGSACTGARTQAVFTVAAQPAATAGDHRRSAHWVLPLP
ncbi:MAG: hypothetical protein IPG92_04350, partial [Flavobacteriales bacterium]|nr:hypothetical protein [Flavobacteriales bacterium]